VPRTASARSVCSASVPAARSSPPPTASVVVVLGQLDERGLGRLLGRDPQHRALDVDWPDTVGWMRVGGVVLGLSLIALLLPRLGFAAAGVLTMMILLKLVERTGWLQSIALSVGSVAAVIGLFDKLLGMPLPRGPWGF
jgi:putative tricarboxylic transport membrane protein